MNNVSSNSSQRDKTPVPLFHSSFGGSTEIIHPIDGYFHGAREQYRDLRGVDPTVPAPNNWESIPGYGGMGTFRIYFEGGDDSLRAAKILRDKNGGEFLRFSLIRPNVVIQWPTGPEYKARVQGELYHNTGLHEIYQSVRIRLGEGFRTVMEYPKSIGWLTVMEFWNQPFWGDLPYPYRISLAFNKPDAAPGSPLRVSLEAQKLLGTQRFETLWEVVDQSYALPIGEWFTLEFYYLEGDALHGRFVIAITPEGGTRRVVIDVQDATHHPDNSAPAGLTHYNPLKLYTSATLVDFVASRGKSLDIDWDDMSIWKNKVPEFVTPLSQAGKVAAVTKGHTKLAGVV